jgi:ribulose-phosphate 3-epimerase
VPIDVHLMVQPVDALALDFAKAGADIITFHPDASTHVDRTLQLIRGAGCQAGLVFNPAMPIDVLEWTIDKVDVILLMSVNPGFGGQSFIDSTLRKAEQVRKLIELSGRDIRLEIDGGIKVDNIRRVADAGADTFVAGSAIFGNRTTGPSSTRCGRSWRAEAALGCGILCDDAPDGTGWTFRHDAGACAGLCSWRCPGRALLPGALATGQETPRHHADPRLAGRAHAGPGTGQRSV